MESKGMLKDIKKKKLNTVQINTGKQLSAAEMEVKQKAVRKLQVQVTRGGYILNNFAGIQARSNYKMCRANL